MAWRTLATFRRKARSSQAAGGEGRESMEHPKFEKEFGCPPQLHSSEVFGGSSPWRLIGERRPWPAAAW